MRSARVKGAWMSTGASDCSMVVVWFSKEESSRGTVDLSDHLGTNVWFPA